MMEHTLEPWATNGRRVESANDHGWANDGWIIAALEGPEGEANARRIVACVNACTGLDTEFLEMSRGHDPSVWKGAEIGRLRKQRDELLAQLEDINGAWKELSPSLAEQHADLIELIELTKPVMDAYASDPRYRKFESIVKKVKGGAA